jgi:aerobic carbon-monoxide dehydrogenase small subunit
VKRTVAFTANGAAVEMEVEPAALLLDVVREQLGLLGARRGCDTGSCGACTVLVDGRAVRSCLFLAARIAGRQLTTIEGLARGDELDPLQLAFVEHGALECGYCIPGMILLARSFLDEIPHPSDDEIRRVLASNLCRCTGYVKMVEAVRAVSLR